MGALESTGPSDRQTLQLLERYLSGQPLVASTAFEPHSYEPRRLHARLHTEQFPGSTQAARLNIRWFTTGDFSIHYVEIGADGSRWECRWDRHPNEHTSRLHFHRPPDGDDVTGLSLPSIHPLAVYATVLDALEQRLTTQWDTG